ncbi:cytochrome-c peroxidase [Novipirellula aureliae]|nr:cytochrome-c peroxidase [Novipirellula aureliae]
MRSPAIGLIGRPRSIFILLAMISSYVTAASESTEKKPPRPERTERERAQWIDELRSLYTTDPQQWPAPFVDEPHQWRELGLLPPVVHPTDNPHSPEKEELGKILFFDPRLSGSGQIACASCHDPDLHWADGRTTSFGHSRTLLTRNAPTIRNSAFAKTLFWDGRAESLESQVIAVLNNPSEMRANVHDVTERLKTSDEYRTRFQASFGDDAITFERIAQAIACFERTIVGGRSRFDAFLNGKIPELSPSELAGLDLFRREARCINCHNGPLFSDGEMHNVGLSYYGRRFEDLGHYHVSGEAESVGQFRTPSLRDVTRTTPLMHNGLFELQGVLNMYNAGMPTLRRKDHQQDDPLFPIKSPLLKPLGLNQQDLADLAAFLKALEEPKLRIWAPPLPSIPPTN